jgi:hypothetical protein
MLELDHYAGPRAGVVFPFADQRRRPAGPSGVDLTFATRLDAGS